MENPHQVWNAGLYDDWHAFVWKHGASLIELLGPKPGERILDLGCGTGHLTASLTEVGAAVVGLDNSADMLARARSAFAQLEFIQGDARDFTFVRPFDAIFSNAVLHWVRPPERVIRCVHDALRPGGRFVAELGGRGNVGAIIAAVHAAAAQLGIAVELPPWYFPGVGDYAPLLESAGLEVRFAALFDRPTPLKEADGLKRWVQMFARPTLEAMAEERREQFLSAVEESARSELFRDGGWIADYRRLRVTAVRRD